MSKNIILGVILLAGCISTGTMFQAEYRFTDIPDEHRIELRFRNDTRNSLCLLPEHWPNGAGKINQASSYVSLLVGERCFPIVEFNTGYCPTGCATHVAPGEEVSASISYEDFNLPDELVNDPKKLELTLWAFICEPGK